MRFLIGWVIMIGTIISGDCYAANRAVAIEKQLIVLLMGPPAAGKGTQASALTEYLGLPHISTGDLFRDNIRNHTEVGVLAKTYIDEGKLVPDQVVMKMLFQRIDQSDCKSGYILDGFPRTVDQAEALDQRLGKNHEVVVLNLNVDDGVLLERITGRLVCKVCSKPHHKVYTPPRKENVCDACEGPLYQRDDDTAEVFKKRLEVYRTQTSPLIAHYGKKGLLRQIDSDASQEQVFNQVIESLPRVPAIAGKN